MAKNDIRFPASIRVRILKQDSGRGYCAQLPDYDVFTEADSAEELQRMINDLLYEVFSVPKPMQRKVRYIIDSSTTSPEKVTSLVVMTTPDIIAKTIYA